MLKSKIHMATVTSCEHYYEGSIAVCPELLAKAKLTPGEKVSVLNSNNANRFETYIIEGQSGEIGLRGPAAKLGKVGHKVIILAFGVMSEEEAKKFKPSLVYVDDQNRIKRNK